MRRLVSQSLNDCPVPAELELPPSKLRHLIGDAANSLLAAKLAPREDRLSPDERRKLAQYANWLESLSLLLPEYDIDAENAFYVASSIHELLAANNAPIEKRDALQLLGTTLLAGAGSHPAVGAILGNRCVDIVKQMQGTDFAKAALLVIANLAARKHHTVIEQHRYVEQLVQDLAKNIDMSDLADVIGYTLIARESAKLSWAMLFGASGLADAAIKSVEEPLTPRAESSSFTSEVLWLARRWFAFSKAHWNRSSQHLLSKAGFKTSYLRRLASDGIVELWPQQIGAIDSGLLTAKNFVIAIPTGSGKTLLAELFLIKSLDESQPGWACYLVPTRALVSQVQRELSFRLFPEGIEVRSILAGPEESDILGEELDQLVTPNSLTITTPEKLESYYRFAPENFANLRLLIVDETQVLSDHSRGPIQEQIIARIRLQNPNVKILLLSAVISNVDELADWLGSQTGSYYSTTRLNRQLLSVAVRLDTEPDIDREYSYRGERRRKAFYYGGLVTDFDIEESIELAKSRIRVGIAPAFKIITRESLKNSDWVQLNDETKANDYARQMAMKFHMGEETTLIFCPQRRIASNQAKTFCEGLAPETNPQQERLAKTLAAYLGDNHPLLNLVQRGVAYHHSLLPAVVQRLLELGVREHIIRTLFTTTTLREGINLPARNVIIAGEQYFDEERGYAHEMDVPSFVNIIGRAGRPHMDTYGVAILVPNQLRKAIRLGRKFFLYGPEALAVVSAMERLVNAIQAATSVTDFENFRASDQSLVLSMYASGIQEKTSLTSLFEATLAYSQMGFDSDELASFCVESFEWLQNDLGKDRLDILTKLGFGLQGSLSLQDFVKQHLNELSRQSDEVNFGSQESIELANLCIEGCKGVPELRVRSLKNDEGWESGSIRKYIVSWIKGDKLPLIAQQLQSGQDIEEAITETVEVTSDIAQWLPWGVGSIHYLVSSLGEEPNKILSHLPLYIRFGVPTRMAALLSLVGVYDRDSAISLAEKCDIEVPTLRNVEEWYTQADLNTLLKTQPSLPILQRRQSILRLASVPLSNPRKGLETGTPLVVRQENGSFVARLLDGKQAGELGSPAIMQKRFGKSTRDLFGVVLSRKKGLSALIADLG